MFKQWMMQVREKIWLTPAIYSVLATLLAAVVALVDFFWTLKLDQMLPSIFVTEIELAQTILSGLATSLLTMTTFTFSTIMVVLTTYASQFSPRTIKNFINDRMTLHVLGIFIGGFIYPTLSLLFMRNSLEGQSVIAGVVGVVVAIICLFFFAVFIHHVATNIQVSNLINRLAEDADEVIEYYRKQLNEQQIVPFHKENWHVPGSSFQVLAQSYGYIQSVDLQGLLKLAAKHELCIEVNEPIGCYVHEITPLLTVYAENKDISLAREIDFCSCFIIGKERDVHQDPVFALQKIAEVALRAISPGINDPNTANDCIRHLGRLVGDISYLPDEGWVWVDQENRARIRWEVPSFHEIIYKTFYQLRHYGKEDVSVILALLDSLQYAMERAPESRKSIIAETKTNVIRQIDLDQLEVADHDYLVKKLGGIDFAN